MSDIIRLLPDSVANQIAAGEVIQRPASAIKELVENAVDAGSTIITVVVKDGGKGLIQVIDNGCGMTATDARMSFERHATSKIREAKDLFAIHTLGFRGEALASIASVAEVELRTRRHDEEVGTMLRISGSKVEEQEPVSCPAGSNFIIKNLFFNIPARRKFLKGTPIELKHIITEFERVALVYPQVAFSLFHNETQLFALSSGNLRQRISGLFGKQLNTHIIDIKTETSIIKISGFIGKPEYAKKTSGDQFFFVNGRYFRSPYLNKAVLNAYNQLLTPDSVPSYFIYFETDPASIDVNIHPTKTEIKFEDERAIWQILHASVRESLGKFAVVPSIDFNTEPGLEIPVISSTTHFKMPQVDINPEFNPFDTRPPASEVQFRKSGPPREDVPQGWEALYQGVVELKKEEQHQMSREEKLFEQAAPERSYFQIKGKYILTTVKSGLMLIDQKRAHERILYEKFLQGLNRGLKVSQKELFPQTIQLIPSDHLLIMQMEEELAMLGFEIGDLGNHTVAVSAKPVDLVETDAKELIEKLLEGLKENRNALLGSKSEVLASSMAKAAAIRYGQYLSVGEMQHIIDKLFGCNEPGLSPDGKPTVTILSMEELEKRLR
ncbi:MAG TPA: DNA mismatch repair endonuclease MutL [Williamwhitmania sp.]|nr:DNA mismatch repair endonuclease MutL [Williamwhitmania sp.]